MDALVVPECPVCGSEEFRAIGRRPQGACAQCGSYERHRLMWMYLERFQLLTGNPRVLHFAPEEYFQRRFTQMLGLRYIPVDYEPDHIGTSAALVGRFDICSDMASLPDNSIDLILHNHVLEHVLCDPFDAMREMKRVLTVGGIMLCALAIGSETYVEDMSADLSDDERTQRFGQLDHVRLFGRTDVIAQLEECIGPVEYDPKRYFTREELEKAAIPASTIDGLDATSQIVFRNLA